MSFEPLEIKDILCFTDVINLNIGTLTQDQITLFEHTATLANEKAIPIVLDPVGAGATALRTDTAVALLKEHDIAILKGNASEIAALHHPIDAANTIDSHMTSCDVLDAAKALSHQYQTTVIASGEIDYIVTKDIVDSVIGGTPLMAKVTGMGCIANALCSAYLAIKGSPHKAGLKAMQLMKQAGEEAIQHAKGPGTFMPYFLDTLSTLSA